MKQLIGSLTVLLGSQLAWGANLQLDRTLLVEAQTAASRGQLTVVDFKFRTVMIDISTLPNTQEKVSLESALQKGRDAVYARMPYQQKLTIVVDCAGVAVSLIDQLIRNGSGGGYGGGGGYSNQGNLQTVVQLMQKVATVFQNRGERAATRKLGRSLAILGKYGNGPQLMKARDAIGKSADAVQSQMGYQQTVTILADCASVTIAAIEASRPYRREMGYDGGGRGHGQGLQNAVSYLQQATNMGLNQAGQYLQSALAILDQSGYDADLERAKQFIQKALRTMGSRYMNRRQIRQQVADLIASALQSIQYSRMYSGGGRHHVVPVRRGPRGQVIRHRGGHRPIPVRRPGRW